MQGNSVSHDAMCSILPLISTVMDEYVMLQYLYMTNKDCPELRNSLTQKHIFFQNAKWDST